MRAIASRSAARKIDKKTNTLASLEEVRRRNGFQSSGVSPKVDQVNYRWWTQNTRGTVVSGERTGFPRSRGKGPAASQGLGPFSASKRNAIGRQERSTRHQQAVP